MFADYQRRQAGELSAYVGLAVPGLANRSRVGVEHRNQAIRDWLAGEAQLDLPGDTLRAAGHLFQPFDRSELRPRTPAANTPVRHDRHAPRFVDRAREQPAGLLGQRQDFRLVLAGARGERTLDQPQPPPQRPRPIHHDHAPRRRTSTRAPSQRQPRIVR